MLKKIILFGSVLIFCLAFSSCNQPSEKVQSDSTTLTTGSVTETTAWTKKDLESVLEIPTPDEIVYYHNGEQETFKSDNEKFQKILSLNAKRDNEPLGILLSIISPEEIKETGHLLEYKYIDDVSIQFNLVKSPDEPPKNWVNVKDGSKLFTGAVYGGLNPADELIDYLES